MTESSGIVSVDLIAGRQAIRRFLAQEVPAAVVERLIDAAARAPSAHNRQPWRFCVVRTAGSKTALAQAMGRRLRADRERDGDSADAIEADVQRSYARITQAPLLILVCLTMDDMDRYDDAARSGAERVMAVQSTAMAGENLMLAAEAEGLGACWMCAPLFCPEDVQSALALPADWSPQGLVLVGYPAEAGRKRPRKDRASIVIFR